jgi:aminopeptidase-like protein
MKSIVKYYNIGKNILFPICRSITGNGTLKTLKIIKKEFPLLKICSIRSQTKIFDWKVPPEWNVSEAYVADKFGKKIIDYKKNNLHLMGYSIPINKVCNKKELFEHIYSLKVQPTAIPYITSYYKRRWGFSITYNEKKSFKKKYKNNDKFKVIIKSSLNNNGNLNYGELLIKGKSKQEILVSTYVCHPSMANNELSGPIVSMCLINYLQKIKKLKKTVRFIFIPETIGSIAYLSKNLNHLKENVIGGYNLSCIGDEKQYSCMLSKYGNSPSDDALVEAYKKLNIKKYKKYSFLERGSDERQYNSPGVDLPISSIFRTMYGKYPEYHTSLDNFNLVTPKGISGGFLVAKTSINLLLKKIIPKNLILCEPQMGKRKLYPTLSIKGGSESARAYMNFLQYADGNNTLEKISKKIKLSFLQVNKIYIKLKKLSLII